MISPLLYPVICAGAATYRTDWSAFIRAVGTFAIGFLAAIAAAVVVSLFYSTTFRSEIVDRLSAAGIDYAFVAFFSGLAGIYAFFSPKIHEAIAGIAISVAVIPPIVMLASGSRNKMPISFLPAAQSCFAIFSEFISALSRWSLACIGFQGIEARVRDTRHSDQPPSSGPIAMLVWRLWQQQRERGRRSGSGLQRLIRPQPPLPSYCGRCAPRLATILDALKGFICAIPRRALSVSRNCRRSARSWRHGMSWLPHSRHWRPAAGAA